MLTRVSTFFSSAKGKSLAVAGALATVAGLAAPASAQFTPGTFPTVTFPITLASITQEIAEAGVLAIVAVMAFVVGFIIIRWVWKRMVGAAH